ncbi:MAG: response regulator [Bacteroidales bacterium]|nr:response regulator [Bacteroidales bacterium]
MKQIKLILTALLMIFWAGEISAQMARLYTSGAGLPNSQIYDIYQDSRGFIWIATENGLARFDGMDFNTFNFDRTDDNSIASDFVRTIIQDSYGTYWVGTSAGLQTFDPEEGSFAKIDLDDSAAPSSDQHISAIMEADINGRKMIIAASSGHGLYLIDPQAYKPVPDLLGSLNSSLPSQFIKSIFKDTQNRLWIASEDGGVCVIDLNGFKILDNIIWKGIRNEDAIVKSFVQCENDDILIGTSNYGILIYDKQDNIIRRSRNASVRNCKVESLLRNSYTDEYGDNTFLTGVENGGIKLYDSNKEELIDISIPGVASDISSWKVHCLMEDSQGNIWVGAYQTGLMVIPKSMYGFEQIQLGDRGFLGTAGACVTSIAVNDEDGSIWVGTDGKGLYKIEKDGSRTLYTNSNSSLSNNSIMSLVLDKRGTLWIATYLGGIYSWTSGTGFRPFKDQEAVHTNKTACLAYSRKDDVIYAGTHGNGLSVISAKDEKVLKTLANDMNKWISSLYIGKEGTVWIGTYNGPMSYDNKTGKLVRYDINESLSNRTYSFCESLDGMMWVGTGEGLVSLDRKEGQTKTYTETDGLPSNVIKEIREGNDGNLWIATLNGLSRFNPKTSAFKNYYQHDGLQENEFNAGASHKAADGKLSFGGIKGLTTFYPHIVDQRKYPVPPLYFSDLSVMNVPVRYEPGLEDENILDKNITEATQITLPFKSNMFSIKFTVLEYTNPRKIMYAYKMDGFDNEWKYTERNSRIVSYTNIPSGRYKMMVKAFFEGTPDEFSYREIDIRILPPWYRTTGAYLMYISLCALMVLAFLHWRKRLVIQRKEMEESEIKEMKLKMFTNLSHEIRTPLTLVMNPLKKMREAENDPKQKELYNLMYRNSLRILRIVNQLMDMRKVDSGQMQLHFLETDVVYFIKDIMKSFDNLAVSRNISFRINPANEITNLWIDQGNFDKIIFNILSNAFKHTPENGTISISVSNTKKNNGVLSSQVKEYVEFVIENTGNGVEERHLDKIFDRFFQTDVHDAKVGSGVGLHLTKMLAELHHGDVRAYNTEEGMAFALRIPVGNTHLSEEEMTKPTNHKDLYTKNIPLNEEHFDSHEDVTYAPPVKEERPKATKAKRTVVLVDDDDEMREYLKQELQSIYNIKVCANGKEAWPIITTTIPDAIVTDLKMSLMDGAELCDKVKKNPGTNHIPVIILTSSSDENSQQRCTDCGADRFFTKPISLEILKSAISNEISTRDTIRNKYNKEIDYKYNEIQMSDMSNKLVSKVIETIRKNMENSDFSVEDLSREVGMSRVHLNRKLKETMNISPSNLIRSIRLKQAAYLLINNKVNISEVAYKVGFSTHSYFSNSFHDFFGMTPKEFVAKYMDCKDEDTLKRIFE